MSSSFAIGSPPIDITYTVNPRARRLSLRISNRTGAAKMTLPRGIALRDAMDFAKSNQILATYSYTYLVDGFF